MPYRTGTFNCYIVQTTQGPRRMFTRNGVRINSEDIPQRIYNKLRCRAREQLAAAAKSTKPAPKIIKVSAEIPGFYSPSALRSTRYQKSRHCLQSKADSKPLITPIVRGKCYITPEELLQFMEFINHDAMLSTYLKASGRAPEHVKRYVNNILRRITSTCDEIANYMPKGCIQNWTIIKKLGQGAFGAVFLAEKDGQTAALKIIIDSPDNSNFVPIEDEVRMQRAFAAAGLAPRLYCHAKTNVGRSTIHMILMEPVDFTLNAFMCRDVVNHDSLKAIAMSIFKTLLKMKRLNVTHGDMHTENIAFRVQPDGTYKMLLIDFGQSSLRVHRPLVDAEQLLSDLIELEQASPKITRYISRVLTYYLQKVAGEMRPLKGTRNAFFQRHRSYEPYMGI